MGFKWDDELKWVFPKFGFSMGGRTEVGFPEIWVFDGRMNFNGF